MTMNLVLALIAIAGLGILALLLIFFGSAGKRHKTNPAGVKRTGAFEKNQRFEIEDEQQNTPETKTTPVRDSKTVAGATVKNAQDELTDPALASLGFSAIDDLLVEPEPIAAMAEEDKSPVAPEQFKPAKKAAVETDVIILHVMAPAGQFFVGYELVQALLAAGLRFGEMNIFHYYAKADAQADVLFSLCSAVEPGVFDMTNVGAIACPGLSIFMRISAVANPADVFNLMHDTALQLAEELAGSLCDAKRQPLTKPALAELYQQIEESLAAKA